MNNREVLNVRLLLLDFDGVFTDNCVYIDEKGCELIKCSKYDSYGLTRLKDLINRIGISFYLCVITTEEGPVVRKRCEKLGIDVISGSENKLTDAIRLVEKLNITLAQCAFIGNDLNDLDLLKNVGLSICPADSHPEVKAACDIVLNSNGGQGAVRDACEIFYELFRQRM